MTSHAATLRDARRSLRRRRLVTVSRILALLVVTATAVVANGWLFSDTPTVQAVPSLGQPQTARARTRCSRAWAPRDGPSPRSRRPAAVSASR